MSGLITALALAVAIVQRKRKRQQGQQGLAMSSPTMRSNNAMAIQEEISHCKRIIMESPNNNNNNSRGSHDESSESGLDDTEVGAGSDQKNVWDEMGIGAAFKAVLLSSEDEGKWQVLRDKVSNPACREIYCNVLHNRIIEDPRSSQAVFEQTLAVLSALAGASAQQTSSLRASCGGYAPQVPHPGHVRVTIECVGYCLGILCQQIHVASSAAPAASLFQRVMSNSSSSLSLSASSSSSLSQLRPSEPQPPGVPLLKCRALTQLFISALVAYKQRMTYSRQHSGAFRDARCDAMRTQEWHDWLAGVRAEACRRTIKVPEINEALLSISYLDED